MSELSGYELVLAFDSDDPEFVRGVEVGRLYEMARRCPEPFDQMVHASNAAMVMAIGEATERTVRTITADDDPERFVCGCVINNPEWLLIRAESAARSTRSGSSSPDRDHGSTAGTALPCSGRSAHDASSRSARSLIRDMSGLCWALVLLSVARTRRYLASSRPWRFFSERDPA